MSEAALWIIFAVIFAVLLVSDLVLTNRKGGVMNFKKAVRYVLLYILVAVLFGQLINLELGSDQAASYYAAYLIEMSMSIDNLFVFIVIFGIFMIPPEKQHKVLYWGILGAIVFRAAFIFVGAELLENFSFMMYLFGVILLYTAYTTAFGNDEEKKPEDSFAFKLSKHFRATTDLSSGKFFIIENGKRLATPLFLCLVVIEVSDIMFAFDSVPAALSITTDMFIVYTSNIFAVMGLRSLYFVIKDLIGSLEYLKYGLGVILAFIGVKMIVGAAGIYEVSTAMSLIVIVVVLAITILASVIHGKLVKAEGQ